MSKSSRKGALFYFESHNRKSQLSALPAQIWLNMACSGVFNPQMFFFNTDSSRVFLIHSLYWASLQAGGHSPSSLRAAGHPAFSIQAVGQPPSFRHRDAPPPLPGLTNLLSSILILLCATTASPVKEERAICSDMLGSIAAQGKALRSGAGTSKSIDPLRSLGQSRLSHVIEL